MNHGTEWENYWKWLLEQKGLESYVLEMNQVDKAIRNKFNIEEICHRIYEDYKTSWQAYLETVRANFLKLLETFQNVHLQTSRVKTIDSLLEKVIIKRHKSICSTDNAYTTIDGTNYKNIITDLIGVRIILNYRGNWKEIHQEILGEFPYDKTLFKKGINDEETLSHLESGESRLVQRPKVYYAQNDEIQEYKDYGLIAKLHNKGYRSIHYIVSYQKVYIELQVRTIYDEAWSDCDHSYVYKQDRNKSHSALVKLSDILCQMTNLCNDWGDNMKRIYDVESYEDIGQGTWLADEASIEELEMAQKRLNNISDELEKFRAHIKCKTGEKEV